MPPRGHRSAAGLTRTHSRTSSGSSAKLNLNLQFTQKDPAQPRFQDKPSKRNAHLHHEARNGSSTRLQHNAAAAQRRGSGHSKPAATKNNKPGFQISTPDPDNDDDEWVSSESGAATPCNDSDTDRPVSPLQPQLKQSKSHSTSQLNASGPKDDVSTPKALPHQLPRVDTIRPPPQAVVQQQPTPETSPLDPPNGSQSRELPTLPTPLQPPPQLQPQSQPESIHQPQRQPSPDPLPLHSSPQQQQHFPSSIPKARSETHSPPRRSPDHIHKRQSMTRPPSTHSITSRADAFALRPHPLIRAHSHGYNQLSSIHSHTHTRPVPLAPLTTVLDDTVLNTSQQEQPTSNSSSPTSLRPVSPSLSLKTSSASPVLSQASPTTANSNSNLAADSAGNPSSDARRQLRRTSTSSARSSMTMPNMHPSPSFSLPQSASAQPASATASLYNQRTNHDRQRTLSSSSALAQTLSKVAMRSSIGGKTPSPPPVKGGGGSMTSVHTVVTFPTHAMDGYHHQHSQQHMGMSYEGRAGYGVPENVHPLLPPPYLSAHLTVLASKNPLAESYARVMSAKQAL